MSSDHKPDKTPRSAADRAERDDDVSGVETRRAALAMLYSVLSRGDTLETAQNTACKKLTRSDDAAFAMAIAGETLRHLGGIDLLLDDAMRKPLPADARPRFVLRLMLAQSLILGTPAHAVIATGLPLLAGGPRKLAHGVFSAIDKKRSAAEREAADGGTIAARGVSAILPDPPWLPPEVQERWNAAWGADMVLAARRGLAKAPPLDLSLSNAAHTQQLAEKRDGISLAPGHVRLAEGARLSDDPDFAAGDYWVQNLAASMPVRILGKGAGQSVLDLCAAPGGKTMQLAASGWAVTAVDSSKKRLKRLAENLQRTGLQADIITADLRLWEAPQPCDAIVLDAPCTATGTYRRNPDVLYRIGPHDIEKLTHLQRILLDRAAKWVKPGGRIIYAVCSLEPEEGEAQIAAFLQRNPACTLEKLSADALPPDLQSALQDNDDGLLRIVPDMMEDKGGLDGFFVASLRRTA